MLRNVEFASRLRPSIFEFDDMIELLMRLPCVRKSGVKILGRQIAHNVANGLPLHQHLRLMAFFAKMGPANYS